MAEDNYASKYEMDLIFLRNFDPLTTDILCYARRVNIFLFNIEIEKEVDYTMDGDIYVYIRSDEPKHCVLVVNRRKRKCIREPIVADLCWQAQKSVLLYRKGPIIFNICFKTYEDFSNVSTIVTSILQTSAGASPRMIPSQPTEQQQCFREKTPVYAEGETSKNIQTPNESILTNENVQNIDNKPIAVTPQMKKEDMEKLITALAKEEQSKPEPILIAPLSVGDYTAFEYCPFPPSYLPATTSRDQIGIEEMTSQLSLNDQNIDNMSKEDKKVEDPIHSGDSSGPLNENELAKALVFKIQNDSEFARKMYDEYLRHFKK